MLPLFFGTSDKQLYGVYHQPEGGAGSELGVILCPPFGQEGMRAHRALRQLALLLARRGLHVFRFDLFGTGDSAGDGEEASLAQWLDDIDTAAEELREMAGIDRVVLVGVRLGAMLAVHAAAKRDDVEALVLWDPITDGREYVKEMLEEAERKSRRGETIGINGYPLTKDMRAELEAMTITGAAIDAARVFVVASHERPAFDELRASLSDREGFSFEHVPSPSDWNRVDDFGGVLIPQEVIQAILRWLV